MTACDFWVWDAASPPPIRLAVQAFGRDVGLVVAKCDLVAVV